MKKNSKASPAGATANLPPNHLAPVGALKLTGACTYLSLSKPSIYRLVERGLLRPNRATRHLIFSISELDRFLRM